MHSQKAFFLKVLSSNRAGSTNEFPGIRFPWDSHVDLGQRNRWRRIELELINDILSI
jgi:hypothetical protein